MATNELKTRIILKNDLRTNWTSTNAVTLNKGEVGIVFTPTGSSGANTVTMLVGDGSRNADLYAKASDVYAWAKASTKPTYSASEISGIDDYVTNTSLSTTLSSYAKTTDISTAITNNNDATPTYVDLSSYCTSDFVTSGSNTIAYLWKKNGFVTICGQRRCPASDNSWTANSFKTIINIPSSYRPNKAVPFAVSSFTANVIVGGQITNSGAVQLRVPTVANFICSFCVTYPI